MVAFQPFAKYLSLNIWAKGGSNPHEIALTAPSRLRVYQFHHLPRLFGIRRFLDKFDYFLFLFFLSFFSFLFFSSFLFSGAFA